MVMDRNQLIDDLVNKEDPYLTLQRLIKQSGLTYYKLEKLSGVPQVYFSKIAKGDRKSFTSDTIVKLAMLFELDPIEFHLKFTAHSLLASLNKVSKASIEPASKHTKFYTSKGDNCESCGHTFISFYTGEAPEYGDTFYSECPHCSKKTVVIKSLQVLDKLPEGAIRATKEGA